MNYAFVVVRAALYYPRRPVNYLCLPHIVPIALKA